jgi:hypothetical protein
MRAKTIIAVCQKNTSPWSMIRVAQERTWISRNVHNYSIIHYLSKKPTLMFGFFDWFLEKYRFSKKFGKLVSLINILFDKIINRNIPNYFFDENTSELHVNSYSTYFLFGKRNLALFDWFVKNTNADFLFITNTSSYINIQNFVKLVDQFDSRDLIYAGAIINPESNSFPIVSGAGRLLSRSLVINILQNREFLPFNNLEDICLSELVFKLNVRAQELPRLDIPSVKRLEKLPKGILLQHFHFRCKSDEIPRIDAQIMEMLDSRIFSDSNKIDKTDN